MQVDADDAKNMNAQNCVWEAAEKKYVPIGYWEAAFCRGDIAYKFRRWNSYGMRGDDVYKPTPMEQQLRAAQRAQLKQ